MRANIYNKPLKLGLNVTNVTVTNVTNGTYKEETPTFTGQRFLRFLIDYGYFV